MSFEFDNVLIFGANGWMGRSAISTLINKSFVSSPHNLILIGSRNSHLNLAEGTFAIEHTHYFEELNDQVGVFLNAAFLRRERLKAMSPQEYENQNNTISSIALRYLQRAKPKFFINLSSGAAAKNFDDPQLDLYGKLKKSWEIKFEEECQRSGVYFINCRIYSLTGRYINEYENLALSNFLARTISDRSINVQSPESRRTYIDSEDLCELLFLLCSKNIEMTLDSGGVLTNMKDLASTVQSAFNKSSLGMNLGNEAEVDYFGDFERFNSLMKLYGLKQKTLEEQILRTYLAFEKR